MTHDNTLSPHLFQATPHPAPVPTPPPAPTTVGRGVGEGIAGPEAPITLPQIPPGGGRLIVDRQGNRTVVTSTSVPPQFLRVAHRAQETAFGLMGLLAAIVILGPFARMWARRLEKRAEFNVVDGNAQVLQQQLVQLQQSVDAMSVEVERISESQRWQSKLLHESRVEKS